MKYLISLLWLFLMVSHPLEAKVKKPLPIQRIPPSRSLNPPIRKNQPSLIVLDPGHGGMDKGASSHGVDEKHPALQTALKAKQYLMQKGYRVILTRVTDVFIPLSKRASIANQNRCKLFVSIHFNAAKSTNAKGIEVFYFNAKEPWRLQSSKKLATCLLHRLVAQTGARSRGVKTANFHVIRETNMPAVLVEGGFLTNPGERTLLSDEKYLDRLAKALAEGIDRYYKS
ncbi:MAG: N-acetylmuramoyl-L-alanine amidase [Simkaniaceae bacterium]